MKISALTNRVQAIAGEIDSELENCVSCDIATAFIDNSSILKIESILKENKQLRGIRLLLGTYGYFNRKEDLTKLRDLVELNPLKLEVRVSRDHCFHWKYYRFAHRKAESIYIGSSNFTGGGLDTNGELMLSISGQYSELEVLAKEFDKEWKVKRSGSITEFQISKYPENKAARVKTKTPSELLEFFSPDDDGLPDIVSDKAFLIYLDSDLKVETEKVVRNVRPSWRDEYFACDTNTRFKLCQEIKRILIIDRQSKGDYRAIWAVHTDELVTRKRTPDGKYFIAYRTMSNKKISLAKVDTLTADFGFKLEGRKGVLDAKVLGKNQVKKLQELLG